jgi:hypothetical protein
MENACTGPNEATEALRTQRENTLEKPTYIGKKSRLQIQLDTQELVPRDQTALVLLLNTNPMDVFLVPAVKASPRPSTIQSVEATYNAYKGLSKVSLKCLLPTLQK